MRTRSITIELLIDGERWLTLSADSTVAAATALTFAESWVADADLRSAVVYLPGSTQDLRVTIERADEAEVPE